MKTFTMRTPDNGHAHFRELAGLAPFLIHHFLESGWRGRVVAEPNTDPPMLTGETARKYADGLTEIARSRKGGAQFEAVPVMQITEETTPQMIQAAFIHGVNVFKVYPRYVTTNSANGIVDYEKIYPALGAVESLLLADNHLRPVVQFHAEDPDFDVQGRDKEESFLENILTPIRRKFAGLPISIEHLTTKFGVDWMREQPGNTVASITIHHLMNTADDLWGYSRRSKGLMSVHDGCKPQPKFNDDRAALRYAAMSGNPHFLYGGDDAPHLRHAKKETLRSCCGVWNTIAALPLLVKLFETYDALPYLEAFTSEVWAAFYGYPPNKGIVTLVRESWTMPEEFFVNGAVLASRPGLHDSIVPFWFNEELKWRVVVEEE